MQGPLNVKSWKKRDRVLKKTNKTITTGAQYSRILFPGEDGSWYLRKIEQEIGYPCQNCGKVYKHRGNMRRHVQYECGKPAMFQCSYCERKFHQQSNLKRHFENKHKCDGTNVTFQNSPSPLPTTLPKFSKSITVYRTNKPPSSVISY